MTDFTNQPDLMPEADATESGPVECLGQTFPSDAARRDHYLNRLRMALDELNNSLAGVPWTTVDDAVLRLSSLSHWPLGDADRLRDLAERLRDAARGAGRGKDLLQLWKDEVGFPHGEYDDILRLSDPPYYTACPNPFLGEFIAYHGKPYDPETDDYHREPFAADVSEGKYDPLYKLHPYHTKVPHKAIMRYILHYTEPGDVVLDGFCGTGMTALAAALCSSDEVVREIGLSTSAEDSNEIALQNRVKLGKRRVVLADLSTAATFVSYNYQRVPDKELVRRLSAAIEEVEDSTRWMFITLHRPSASQVLDAVETLNKRGSGVANLDLPFGRINYVVWSDVFVCPNCGSDVIFWDTAVEFEIGKIKEKFTCIKCAYSMAKREAERVRAAFYDSVTSETRYLGRQVPVRISYTFSNRRYEKSVDDFDRALVAAIENYRTDDWYPVSALPEGFNTQQPKTSHNYEYVHDFYYRRNLITLSRFFARGSAREFGFALTRVAFQVTKLYRYTYQGGSWGAGGGPLSGTLYVPSLVKELNICAQLRLAIKEHQRPRGFTASDEFVITTGSSAHIHELSDNSIDYVFIDPPFGGNLMYSELNYIWESWLRILTNNSQEAIENSAQRKTLQSYQSLIARCFSEFYRVLKPGRWMTVEFHNSQNSVWSAIQEAVQQAGFTVADVRILDKQKSTVKQVTGSNAVKQDLVISVYKPNGGLEDRFRLEAGTENGVWDFVRTHLRQLPVFVSKDGLVEVIAERQNYLLFDRMVAFHVQRGVMVPLSAAEFYAGLEQRFSERDGMYFLPEQVAEYDKKRMTAKEVLQLTLFVTDESSAIQWLKQQLTKKPQTFQDLHPQFMKQVGGWSKHEEALELRDLLEQNFLTYDGRGDVPNQIHAYLSSNYREYRNLAKDDAGLREAAKDRWYVPDPNKAGDLEKLRERSLLREFEEYKVSKARKLKVFRLEAVRAGFRKAYAERDYATILAVAEKIPDTVLQEDPKLLMWYDQALTRSGK